MEKRDAGQRTMCESGGGGLGKMKPELGGDVDVERRKNPVTKFLLWLILLVLCWPLALLALVLYPVVWIFLLPFRLLGIAVDGVFAFLRSIVLLPASLVRR
jgi:hypothetical protein